MSSAPRLIITVAPCLRRLIESSSNSSFLAFGDDKTSFSIEAESSNFCMLAKEFNKFQLIIAVNTSLTYKL